MMLRCGALSLLVLCEKDCSILNMLNAFNKLRFIVYEIFDNSQLFLTDPRKWWKNDTKTGYCIFIVRS